MEIPMYWGWKETVWVGILLVQGSLVQCQGLMQGLGGVGLVDWRISF